MCAAYTYFHACECARVCLRVPIPLYLSLCVFVHSGLCVFACFCVSVCLSCVLAEMCVCVLAGILCVLASGFHYLCVHALCMCACDCVC